MEHDQASYWEEYWGNKPWTGSHREFNDYTWGKGMPLVSKELHRKHFVEPILSILKLEPQHHVLEIGCGSGLLLREIAPLVERLVGTDISETMLAQYEGPAETVCCPANKLPFKGPTFDRVFMYGVCFYFPSTAYFQDVIIQCLEALKPGGFLFVGDVIYRSQHKVNPKFLQCDIQEMMEFLDNLNLPYELIAHNKLQTKQNRRKHLVVYNIGQEDKDVQQR
jgi:SAM-dependent methyltransferase